MADKSHNQSSAVIGDVKALLEIADEMALNRRIGADDRFSLDEREQMEAAIRIAVEPQSVRETLEHYATQYCEGWCKDAPANANFDDCGGCRARIALSLSRPNCNTPTTEE